MVRKSTGTGYQQYNDSTKPIITNSMRMRGTVNDRLTRTPTATNRKTWTYSGWVKHGSDAATVNLLFLDVQSANTTGTARFMMRFAPNTGTLDVVQSLIQTSNTFIVTSSPLYRDFSSWYHVVVAMDTTQATASNRIKVYVNGVRITNFSAATYPTLNLDTLVNSATAHYIGYYGDSTAGDIEADGYYSEINFIDGTALTPDYFGRTDHSTGSWIPKQYVGSYGGANGFHLEFKDIALTSSSNVGLGKDTSGNGAYWNTGAAVSVTTGTSYASVIDTPTNNFCMFNSLVTDSSVGVGVVSKGALSATVNTTTAWTCGTIELGSGKWYAEFTMGTGVSASTTMVDVGVIGRRSTGVLASTATYLSNGQSCIDSVLASFGTTYSSTGTPVIGVAVDTVNKTASFFLDGTPQGSLVWVDPYLELYIATANRGTTVGARVVTANYGQGPLSGVDSSAHTYYPNAGGYFKYAPPVGYKALCTKNL